MDAEKSHRNVMFDVTVSKALFCFQKMRKRSLIRRENDGHNYESVLKL